jgi:hypothetical protein
LWDISVGVVVVVVVFVMPTFQKKVLESHLETFSFPRDEKKMGGGQWGLD